MQDSRRAFLASGAAVAASLAGCAARDRIPLTRGDSTATSTQQSVAHDHDTQDDDQSKSSFSEETLATAKAVGTTVQRSVVKVEGSSGSGGTGWVYADDQIVTNAHVVRGDTSYTVTTFDGETADAERIGYDEDMQPDVGLLSADVSTPPLPRGSVDDLSKGDPLLTVGHPSRVGEWLISLGRFTRYDQRINWVLSTVPTRNGNSGGPLVTTNGDVIGLLSGSTTLGQNDPITKSDRVFTEFPKPDQYTTGNPVSSVEELVTQWTK